MNFIKPMLPVRIDPLLTEPSRTSLSRASRIRAMLTLACVTALTACAPTRGSDPIAELDACRLRGVDASLRCGQIQVAEDPAQPAGRQLAISFVVIPAVARNKLPDPIFVFAGGPGQAASDIAAQVLPLFQGLNRRRDIVLVDQRGTGRSHALKCPALADLPLSQAADPNFVVELARDCWQQLDADPRQYTTEIAVRDLDAVRARLGYQRINLWGAST